MASKEPAKTVAKRRPIPPQDALWMSMDLPHNLMVIDALLWFDSVPDWDALEALAMERLVGRFPAFRRRAVSTPSGPVWEEVPDFDLSQHVVRGRVPGDGTIQDLEAFVGAQRSVVLDPSRPRWIIHALEGLRTEGAPDGGGAAVLGRFHHSMADGIRLTQAMLSLCDVIGGDGTPATVGLAAKAKATTAAAGGKAGSIAADVAFDVVLRNAVVAAADPQGSLRRSADFAQRAAKDAVTGAISAAGDAVTNTVKFTQDAVSWIADTTRRSVTDTAGTVGSSIGEAWGAAVAGDVQGTARAVIELPIRLGQGMDGLSAGRGAPLDPARLVDWTRVAATYPVKAAGDAATAVSTTATAVSDAVGTTAATVSGAVTTTAANVSDAVNQFVEPVTGPITEQATTLSNSALSVRKLFTIPAEQRIWAGKPGIDKRAAWTGPIDLTMIKAIGKANGYSLNDVMMAAVAGAMRRDMLSRGEEPKDVFWAVPVNIKPFDKNLPKELGNHFALVYIELPVSEATAKRRLAVTNHRIGRIKQSHEALITFGAQRAIALTPDQITAFLSNFFGNKAIGVLTNVPGPRGPIALAGTEVAGITGFAPGTGDERATATIFSYAGNVTVGFALDAGTAAHPQTMVDHIHAEIDEMKTAAGL